MDLLQKLNSGSKSEDGVDGNESESDYSDDEYEDDEEDDKDSIIGVPVPGPGSSFESPEEFAATKAALLKSRILEYFDSRWVLVHERHNFAKFCDYCDHFVFPVSRMTNLRLTSDCMSVFLF